MKLNLDKKNFRLFGPDETASNRLDAEPEEWMAEIEDAVYEVSGKEWMAEIEDVDINLSVNGRVMEVLSEHLYEGWLEGYLLTGRHGLFSCYEAFIHVIDSMFNQHAKWLKVSRKIPWRKPIASLNYLLTSHVWRQDHNGFSHQDPGFIDHAANKKADIVRIYLPPDANCLLSVADHCLRSRNYINLIIAGKQPEWQWLDIDLAVRHCTAGAGIWRWASNDAGDPGARCRGKSVSLLLTSRYVDRIAGSALGARQDPQSVFNLRLIVQNHTQPTSVVGPVSAVNGWAEHVGSARYFRRQLVQLWPHHRSQRLNENFSPRHGPAMVAIIKFGASWLTDKEQ